MPRVRIHGDCHVGNILWRSSGPLFVDLDDCMAGPRIQDLWMFLSGDGADQQSSWAALMEGYELFGELDFAELTLVESLRSLRMLHHAAWIANRWHDPHFHAHFPGLPTRASGTSYLGPARTTRGDGRSTHSVALGG